MHGLSSKVKRNLAKLTSLLFSCLSPAALWTCELATLANSIINQKLTSVSVQAEREGYRHTAAQHVVFVVEPDLSSELSHSHFPGRGSNASFSPAQVCFCLSYANNVTM